MGGILAASAPAAVWDFESDTVGSAPTNGLVFSDYQAGTQVKVVDAGSIPADPFGGSGNQSLWMEDTAQSNSTLTYGVGSPGYVSGTMSTQIYLLDDASNALQYFDVNGGTGNANTGAGDIGPWIQYNSESFGFRAITSSGIVNFTNPVPHNTVLDMVIQFDATTDTFTGTLQGNPLTDGTNTTFNFFNSLTELTSVRIVHSSSAQAEPSSTTFYDNVTLVPEPAAMGLVGVGALAFIRRSRRS
jgi:MYXO-CTERM domain-containing protein